LVKNQWEIVHDSDDEDGNPTCWCKEINHKKYGKYVWISHNGTELFDVEVSCSSGMIESIMPCKSLTSAKRWVTINL
jgi:hypothetical protein